MASKHCIRLSNSFTTKLIPTCKYFFTGPNQHINTLFREPTYIVTLKLSRGNPKGFRAMIIEL